MGRDDKEYLGSCDCIAADGDIETISSYRAARDGVVFLFHRSKNMLHAEYCDKTGAFFVAGKLHPYHPTEPLMLLAG